MAQPVIQPTVPVLKKNGQSHFVIRVTDCHDRATVEIHANDPWLKDGAHTLKRKPPTSPHAYVRVKVKDKPGVVPPKEDEISNITVTVTNPTPAPNEDKKTLDVWVMA
jgi:hypothetical protein